MSNGGEGGMVVPLLVNDAVKACSGAGGPVADCRNPTGSNPFLFVVQMACHEHPTEICNFMSNGGEGGIRTLGTLLGLTRFPVVRLRPLGHLSTREK